MAAGKMRWGDADFEGGDGEVEAPAPYETEPDENGVKTIVSYDTKDDGTKVKVRGSSIHHSLMRSMPLLLSRSHTQPLMSLLAHKALVRADEGLDHEEGEGDQDHHQGEQGGACS